MTVDSSGAPQSPDGRVDPLIEKTERLSQELRASVADLAAVRSERDRVLADLERMRRRRAVRTAMAVADRARDVVVGARAARSQLIRLQTSVAGVTGFGPLPPGQHRLRASARAQRALEGAITASMGTRSAEPGPGLSSGPAVSVLIRRSAGSADVDAAVRAVEAAIYPDLQVAVVEATPPALADALAASTGDFVLLLHDDVQPAHPAAIGRLVQTLLDAPDEVAAVGARLILPRRQGPAMGPQSEARDLTLAHGGVSFVPENGIPRPRSIGRGGDPLDPAATAVDEVPAASDACLLVRRSSLAALDDDGDRGDADDGIDLSLRLRDAGHRILVDGGAAFWHAETSSLDATPMPTGGGPRLFRSVFVDRLEGSARWSREPFHLAITVTSNDAAAGYGDWYTAHELGDALEAIGWRVSYVERQGDRWYELPADTDAVVALIDLYDLRRIPRGIVRIAWIRSWTEHWLERPWFDDYDLVLTSSEAAKERIDRESAALASVFPIATNPERFRAAPESVAESGDRADVAFVGSHFGEAREIATGLPALAARGRTVSVWGHRWDQVPGMSELTNGPLPYDEVPDAYRSARIVVDDAVAGTREFGLMNSRVFDALAAGTLVVTNNEIGARELFDDDFPTWTDPASLVDVVDGLLADPDRRAELAARYAAVVRERHTYASRARDLRQLLRRWAEGPRLSIAVGARTWPEAERWGDLYFARALQRGFARRGLPTTVHPHGEWPAAGSRSDVALHLFGARAPVVSRGQISLLWIISHPDYITPELCEPYDRVFVASDGFAARLAERTKTPVVPLHQATDPERFWPDPTGPAHELLFVGSSRGLERPVVSAAASGGHELAVYGTGWTSDLLDLRHVRGEWIPNEEVRRYYSSAKVVLADHYDDMRDQGFISNRIYDALACGSFVLSDDVPGIDAEFDGAVVACDGPEAVLAGIERYLGDAELRAELARRGRAAVLDRHTFALRVGAILATVEPLLGQRDVGVRRETEGIPTHAG